MTPARAQSALEEVVVTAQRREQTAQDVSVSMGVFSGAEMQEKGIQNVADIAKNMANVSFNTYFEAGKPDIVIRGITIGQVFSANSVAPVGFYYDDVFVGARSGQLSQMFDVERVEVLRGPQGTLFGRNTTGGAINVIDKKPGDKFEVEGSVTYGRFNEKDIDAAVTLPISDTLSVRFAAIRRNRDGWVTNTYPEASPSQRKLDNVDNWGARGILRWSPNENMTWLLNIHGDGNDSKTPVVFQDLGSTGANVTNPLTGYKSSNAWNQVSLNYPSKEELGARGTALTGNIRFGALTLTSITGYDRVDYTDSYDLDGGPFALDGDHHGDITESYSQEFRLSAKTGPIDWVGGLYYYHEQLKIKSLDSPSYTDPIFAGSGYAGISYQPLTQTSLNYAGYADGRLALTDSLTLGVGGRFTHEQKSAFFSKTQIFPDESPTPVLTCESANQHSWNAPTGRVVLEWRPQEHLMTYVSASHGFKSGGFSDDCTLTQYEPESVNAYEIGEKGTFMEGRVVANLAVFYNEVNRTQALTTAPEPGHPNILTYAERNAANSTVRGGELEVHLRPIQPLTASFSVGVADAQYGSFFYQPGEQLGYREVPFVPQKTFNTTLQYEVPIPGGSSVSPEVTASYKSHVWFDAHELPGIDEQNGYTLIDAAIPWRSEDGRYEVSLWGKNLTDKHYFYETLGYTGLAYFGAGVSYHGEPRTYGVTLRFRYN